MIEYTLRIQVINMYKAKLENVLARTRKIREKASLQNSCMNALLDVKVPAP